VTAPNMDARGEVGTEGRAQGTAANLNCAAIDDAARKLFEHLRALLALRDGHVVHELATGGYLVAWKSWTRECRDLAELEAHARRVGAL
jgi:hypothetical protein